MHRDRCEIKLMVVAVPIYYVITHEYDRIQYYSRLILYYKIILCGNTISCDEHFVIIIIINDVLDYEIYVSYSTRHYLCTTTLFVRWAYLSVGHFNNYNVYTRYIFLARDVLSLFLSSQKIIT